VTGVVRAAVMRAPGAVEVAEFPYPELEDGAVLLRVSYSGVCGTDKHTYRGETNLENLVSLCRRHHRLVHERGYSIGFDDDGETLFTNQYGIAIPNVPRSPPSHRDALPGRHRRLEINGNTCRNGDGDRMELGLAVDAISSIAVAGALELSRAK